MYTTYKTYIKFSSSVHQSNYGLDEWEKDVIGMGNKVNNKTSLHKWGIYSLFRNYGYIIIKLIMKWMFNYFLYATLLYSSLM